jgi:hypothetical protein
LVPEIEARHDRLNVPPNSALSDWHGKLWPSVDRPQSAVLCDYIGFVEHHANCLGMPENVCLEADPQTLRFRTQSVCRFPR